MQTNFKKLAAMLPHNISCDQVTIFILGNAADKTKGAAESASKGVAGAFQEAEDISGLVQNFHHHRDQILSTAIH